MEYLHIIFCSLLILSAITVSFSTNPVQSVLFLILTFCQAGVLLIMFNVDFFGLIFIIIYVGAIAVLFLFVIMMLNVKIQDNSGSMFLLKSNLGNFFIIISSFYAIFITLFATVGNIFSEEKIGTIENYMTHFDDLNNIDILGQVLYNYYFVCFLLSGLILLVALVGAIVLTLRFNEIKKYQLSNRQLSRTDKFISFFS
jgi:NADH-quinone oxidoreductase subunit J